MSKVFIMDHPLIQHKVSHLRSVETGSKEFRELTREISQLMCFESTRDLPLENYEIETPIGPTIGRRISGKTLSIVPILRAGLGMVDGILDLVPTAKVGHIGLYRDPKTLEPVEYYCKLPDSIQHRKFYVLDPMLATGGSAVAAIQFVKDRGAKDICFLCIIAAPEGLKKLQNAHPDIEIYIAALDERLNDHGYIVPGLGDAGDRLFGTK
ncbi:uracil phosphoribosyltransferase [Candidatus Epulonipiscium fishelsonii]|uniref:Uracil phosphoribosyltransferase n=2 Tax=Candidatus Epulonipiscium fishelsonii TaxID=77094 RepID=A0ACC8XEM2_9FIRM|nr:uracil phosphoribosyltransferase [Epulopiscium sp. SCG-B11WGA-EpuloA1]ONI41613.1 uracil phosphoribosyltransferase [Epulopiscium sp. SCG-B11WGA-EpuloA1]ONI43925.1 uracil phosphoribosyltransferase [Epulopiscium sp. SCG-B05WGA-EpuloA1]